MAAQRNAALPPNWIARALHRPTHTISPMVFAFFFPIHADLHESDTQEISIPFELNYYTDSLTTPGLALGVGDRFNVNEDAFRVSLSFDLTNGQYINLSEVRTYIRTVRRKKKSTGRRKPVRAIAHVFCMWEHLFVRRKYIYVACRAKYLSVDGEVLGGDCNIHPYEWYSLVVQVVKQVV